MRVFVIAAAAIALMTAPRKAAADSLPPRPGASAHSFLARDAA